MILPPFAVSGAATPGAHHIPVDASPVPGLPLLVLVLGYGCRLNHQRVAAGRFRQRLRAVECGAKLLDEVVLGDAVNSCHQVLHEVEHAIPSRSAEPSRPWKLFRLLTREEIVPVEFAVDPQELDCCPAVDRRLGLDVRQDQQGDNGRDGRNVC